jgi:hypothetical protein
MSDDVVTAIIAATAALGGVILGRVWDVFAARKTRKREGAQRVVLAATQLDRALLNAREEYEKNPKWDFARYRTARFEFEGAVASLDDATVTADAARLLQAADDAQEGTDRSTYDKTFNDLAGTVGKLLRGLPPLGVDAAQAG